jgi:enterochelin esterase family protein
MKIPFLTAVFIFAAFVAAAGPPNSDADTPWRVDAASPRLQALKKQVEGGNRAAVEQFWLERKTAGTPLIEPMPGDGRHVLLTFLFRAGGETKGVVLNSLLTGRENAKERVMGRLLDTDVWYKTYWIRNDMRFSYGFVTDGNPEEERRGLGMSDPFNTGPDAKSVDAGGSVLVLPAAPPQPWIRPAANVPTGKLQAEQVASKVLNVRRTARVYTPAGYDPNSATPYALLVCFDGPVYSSANRVPTPTILDNLIARGDIPPVVAVFVDQSASRNAELCNNRPFVDFLADELLPHVRRKWHATADPARTVVCGSSAGGLGSAFAAFARPDVFGNVLSQSGAFWPGRDRNDAGREWLTAQFESSPRRESSRGRAVHFVLQVGVMERHPTPSNGPGILQTNRHLRDVLSAKGYPLHYSEVAGGHEPLSWRGGIGEGLVQLIGKEVKQN